MKTIKICGVSCNVELMPSFEQLLKMALVSKDYYKKPDAEKLIIKELKKHGITDKSKKARKKTNTDNTKQGGESVQSRGSIKPKGDN